MKTLPAVCLACLAALCLNASETWHFLPNFQCDIRGVGHSARNDADFFRKLPAAAEMLLAPGSPLTEAQRGELYWHPAAFPHRDFVKLMPGRNAYGWYGCRFDIPAELQGMDVIADLGIIDDTDESFVNGKRTGGVGTVGKPHGTAWQTERLYRIPADVLTPCFNILAVHVWSLWGLGGIVGPPVLKAAVAPQGAQWELAFAKGAAGTRGGLNLLSDAESALAAVSGGEPLEWTKTPVPWSGFAAWPDDVHYAVFRLRFDLLRPDGTPRLLSSPAVMDAGPVFDTAAFYLNGRRVGLAGRFPGGGEPAFTEAAQRGQFIVSPGDWAEDGHNELVAVAYRERGVGGLPGVPGILLSNPLEHSTGQSFAEKSTLFNILLQSERLSEAARVLETTRAQTGAETAWLLSHRAHLAFLKWRDGGKKDGALLDGILAPVAEILTKYPAEAPKQSAMQAFCRVLRLAENDEGLMAKVRSHLPHFGEGCVCLPSDRRTLGDWPLAYGNSFFALASMGKLADLAGSRDGDQGVALRTGEPEDPARHWQPSNARRTSASGALVLPASQLPAVWRDSAAAQEFLKTGRLFPRQRHRRAAWWDDHGEMHPFDDDGPNLFISLKAAVRQGQVLSVHLGDFDWRTTCHPRQQSLILRDGTGQFRNAAWSGKSGMGVYERFRMTSDLRLEIACQKHRSACSAVSGIFIDDSAGRPHPTGGTPLKFISDRASAAWEIAMEAEESASLHSAVGGYLACLGQLSEPGELVSLLENLRHAEGIHPVWQYAAAGRLAQMSADRKMTADVSGMCPAPRMDFQAGIPVPLLDVLMDLKRSIGTGQSSEK